MEFLLSGSLARISGILKESSWAALEPGKKSSWVRSLRDAACLLGAMMTDLPHDVLPYARVRASLSAAVSAAQQSDWVSVLQHISPELLSYSNLNTRAQACAIATWAHWMLGDIDACHRIGDLLLRLARSDSARVDQVNGPHLRYWILEGMSPVLAAVRSDLRTTIQGQRKGLLEVFGLLEDTGRLWLMTQSLYAVRYLEQLSLLLAERRNEEAAWLLRCLGRLAQQPLEHVERIKIYECLATAELLTEIATANRAAPLRPWPTELANTAAAWRAARTGSAPDISLCEGGLPGLFRHWLQTLQRGAWQFPSRQPPRAFLAATVCWAATLGRLAVLEPAFPRQVLCKPEIKGALATRIEQELAEAIVHWCEHPSLPSAQQLTAECAERNWTCLLI